MIRSKLTRLANSLANTWRHMTRRRSALAWATVAAASLAQAPAAHAFTGDWWGSRGSFSLSTYNIAGLPYFINSPCTLIPGWQLLGRLPLSPSCLRPEAQDPLVTTYEIGRRINRFDVVHVQEDFNYHAYLYDGATSFPFRTPTQGGIPFGSGLNSLSKMSTYGFERIRWRNCRTDSCPIPKGFTFQRLMLGQGSYMDLYNLHAHAGDSPEDLAVRRDNMNQLAEFINARSPGNAVIVAGDTNMRYTRGGENIREFLASTGMRDAWIDLPRRGNVPGVGWPIVCEKGRETEECEVVDKIFYRSGADVNLRLTNYINEDRYFLDDRGRPLSDHRPVTVWMEWEEVAPKFVMVAQNSGKCLNVAGQSNAPGAQVIQWDCLGGVFDGNEKLRQIGNTLRFTHTGMCLEVKDFSTQAGAPVIQWPCHGGANQRVRFDGQRIVFEHSNMCLDVSNISNERGAALHQWPCHNGANQRFARRF